MEKRLLLACMTLIGIVGQAKAEPIAETRMLGQPITLIERDGQCVIVRQHQQLNLDMQWPCNFSPDRSGQARIEQFRNVPIVLVTHTEPHPTMNDECLTTARAVRLGSNGLEASLLTSYASCSNGVTDQKLFVGLFDW